MSEADWTLLEGTQRSWRKPKREIVATDGQKLTLGDTTLTLHITPGHTLGTISTLIPGARRRRRGTWRRIGAAPRSTGSTNRTAYITPERPIVSGSTTTSSRRSASGSSRATPAPT